MTRFFVYVVIAIVGLAFAAHPAAGGAAAHEHADPKIQTWYKSQRNAQGQWCCDESDGHPYYGSYTLNKDGSVTLHLGKGKNHTLPAYMIINGPNPTGHAVWWYMESGGKRTDFCFAPGTLT